MRILITGSRDWPNYESIRETLDAIVDDIPATEPVTVVHGACPTGADYFAVTEEAHPADWNTHGKAAGPLRNQHMVNLGADMCIAFPLGASRGTWHCIKAANAAGIPVFNEAEETRR